MSAPTVLPCPFCGSDPKIITRGAHCAQVQCISDKCPTLPGCFDGIPVNDDRGIEAYKAAAITRWNLRA